MPLMDIDPQAVINALSQQIGALQTENTVLKMALQQIQADPDGAHDSTPAENEEKPAEADISKIRETGIN